MSSTPEEIRAMIKAGIPVAIVPRVRKKRKLSFQAKEERKMRARSREAFMEARAQIAESRASRLISSLKRRHPSISREAVKIALKEGRKKIRMARRARRTRLTTNGVVIPVRDVESNASRHVSLLRNNIKQMLIDVRGQSGLTQTAVADKLGVKAANISRLESGRLTPSIVTIDAFLKACGFELNFSAEKINAGATTSNAGNHQSSSSTPAAGQ